MTGTFALLLQVAVSALVALLAVALTHSFTSYRDRQNRRREQRIHYLVSVYRAFCKCSNHPNIYEYAEEIEQAVADVQLFGTPRQVELVQQFATELGTRHETHFDDLLVVLRDSLRAELGADPLQGRNVYLRINREK